MIKEDAVPKIRGEAIYTDDIIGDFLHGKTLRSERAHAKIIAINYPEMPEGYFIVDKRDIPKENAVKIVSLDQPVLADSIVRYVGEPIAIIVGPDKNIVRELIHKILVKYEDLQPLLTMEDSLRSDPNNVFADLNLQRGDLADAKLKASHHFTLETETGVQEHVYLEPQSMTAEYTSEEIIIRGSIQSFYAVKQAVEYCTGFPARIIEVSIGGGFGGKEDFPSLVACHAALAALKCKGKVKIIYDRHEDIVCTTKRHPSHSRYDIYLDENLKILGVEADLKLEAGAYEGLSNLVLELMLIKSCGVYSVPSLKIRARSVKTNKLSFGAWRGFGAPQANFGIEVALDLIAKKLGIDSVELKIKNLAKQGGLDTTGGIYKENLILTEMLESILKKSDYYEKIKTLPKKIENRVRGIGISFSTLGGGLTGNVERDLAKSKIRLKKSSDGKIIIYSSIVDMGQGSHTTLREIAADTLEIPFERVIYSNPDSKFVPDLGPTVASRSVLIVGKLVERACLKLKDKINSTEEIEITEEFKQPEDFIWNSSTHIGDSHISNSFAVNAVEIEIDLETYRIYPIKYWGAYDIGRPIDDLIALGQIHGGASQALGYSYMEVMNFNSEGRLMQSTLTDYLIPTSKDTPEMEIEFFKNLGIQGPLGAKALGELPFIGIAPAFLSALNNALGTSFSRVPLNPEYLMEAIDESKI